MCFFQVTSTSRTFIFVAEGQISKCWNDLERKTASCLSKGAWLWSFIMRTKVFQHFPSTCLLTWGSPELDGSYIRSSTVLENRWLHHTVSPKNTYSETHTFNVFSFSLFQSSTDLMCFIRLEKVSVYTCNISKQKYRAPTSFCFMLKVSHSLRWWRRSWKHSFTSSLSLTLSITMNNKITEKRNTVHIFEGGMTKMNKWKRIM